MTNKMIMIAENRPGLETPAEVGGDSEQTAVEHAEALCAAKVVQLQVRAGGEEIGPTLSQLVSRCVRPGSMGRIHGRTVGKRSDAVKRICESWRAQVRRLNWRSFWSAPVFSGAFSFDRPTTPEYKLEIAPRRIWPHAPILFN